MKVINLTDITDELEAGKTYTLWQENTGAVYGQINEVLNGVTKYIYSQTQNKVTFVAKEGAIYSFVAQASTVEVTGTLTNYKNRFMVYEGTDDKEFEQYGVMPSLQYPSEIEAVGDNVNLFNKDTISENKYINLGNGALGNSTTSNTSDYIKVYANEEYVLSYEYETLLATGKRVCCYFDENKNYIKGIEYTSTNKETVFSSSQNGYIRFSCDKNTYNVKLEKGTKATSYSEFGRGSVEITTSNKNVLEETFNDKTKKGQFSSIVRGNFVLREGLTYTVSFDTNNNGGQVYINEFLFNTSQRRGCNGKRQSLTATAKKTGNFIDEVIIKTALTTETAYDISNVQIELADTNSDYVEHRGETLTMPIQSKMFEGDTFEQIGDVWYEKHCKKEKTITGNDIQSVSSNNRVFFKISSVPGFKKISEEFYYGNIDKNTIESNVATSLTGHSLTWLATAKKGDWISSWNNPNDTNGFVLRTDKEFATKEEAIIYFNENPFTVVYELLEIEYIKCTAEQCKILDKIDTYKDGTIITTDNDLCKIQLRYKQDLEKRITALEKQIATQTVAESE